MLISEKYILRLYQYELLIFAFLLPIYRKVIPYVIASIVITWFLDGDFARKLKRLGSSRHRQYTLLFAGLYVLYMLGFLYTRNQAYGLFVLEVKLSLFIFPVIFATASEKVLSPEIARKVLASFVMGVLAAMLICYSYALYSFIGGKGAEVFYYSRLSVFIHPSYLSMYVTFAIAILLYHLLKRKQSMLSRIMVSMLIASFELFIIMLSSKAGILSLVLMIAIYTSYVLAIEKRFLSGLVSGSLLMGIFVLLFLLFPSSAERFQQSREALNTTNIRSDQISSSTGERIMIWWYSFEITNENFLFGVGTGDAKSHLLDKYDEKGMTVAHELELNAHNQYLQTMITLGVVGLSVLLLCLIVPAMICFERRHYLYMVFLLLIAFHFLFESMLETQAGVVFYAFFNAYLFAIKKDPASEGAGPL